MFPLKFSASQKLGWLEQLQLLLAGGVSLRAALELLGAIRAYARVSRKLLAGVDAGLLLSQAMARVGSFDAVDRAFISYGERTDQLQLFLQQLTDVRRQQLGTQVQIKRALRYPALVLVSALAIVALLTLTVLPAFARIFADSGQQLPPLSLAVFASAEWLLAHWRELLIGCAAPPLALRLASYHPRLRRWLTAMLYWLPVVAGVKRHYDQLFSIQFLHAAALCGLSTSRALDLLPADALGGRQRRRLRRLQKSLLAGEELHSSFQRHRVLPMPALRLIAIGARQGDLLAAFAGGRRWLEIELQLRLERIVAVLQPSLSLALAAFVALLVAAIYLPLISVGQAF